MKSEEFKRLLRHGLGRAVLYGQAHGLLAYREELWAACVENPAFDRQMEGERSEFLFDLISCSGEPEWYRRASIDLLNGPDDPDEQIYEIVRRFAAQGDSEARKALYGAFNKNLPGSALNGESLIRLDGPEGYRCVIAAVGGTDNLQEEAWIRCTLHSEAEDRIGIDLANAILEEQSKVSEKGKGFEVAVKHIKEPVSSSSRRPDAIIGQPFSELAEKLAGYGSSRMRRWAKTASDADIQAAGALFESERKIDRIRAFLGIFSIRSFEGPLDVLLRLTAHADRSIGHRARNAIGKMRSPEARAYAIKALETGAPDSAVIGVLSHTYEPGDEHRVLLVLDLLDDEEAVHHAQFEVRDFYEAHPEARLEERALIWLYENNPCSYACRDHQVKRLIQIGALPDWMRKECTFDASMDIRRLVGAMKSGKDSEG